VLCVQREREESIFFKILKKNLYLHPEFHFSSLVQVIITVYSIYNNKYFNTICIWLMRWLITFFTFFLLNALTYSNQNALSDTDNLWEAVENPSASFKSAMTAIVKLREKYHMSEDPSIKIKFKSAIDKISAVVRQSVKDATQSAGLLRYSYASNILDGLLEHEEGLLDKKTKSYIKSQLINYRFREALVGNYSWASLVVDIETAVSLQEIGTEFDYYLKMGRANHLNEEVERKSLDILAKLKDPSAVMPYVLSFELPQQAQTPSLGHFGHVSKKATTHHRIPTHNNHNHIARTMTHTLFIFD
jgi:hypothetical protein